MTQHVLAGMVVSLVLGAGVCAAEPPRAEHPRPDMMRGAWMTLNGEWEFAETDDDKAEFLGEAAYPDKITVPFCRESALSGLGRTGFIRNVWYRRTFDAPAGDGWSGRRVRLHIGACDWRTRVWVNGTLMGTHTGGSAPFWFDVTAALKPGANTVIVHAYDDVRSGVQSSGKQSQKLESHGCVYTRTTGIWQPVWLEAVGSAFIEKLRVTPDVASGRVTVWARVDGAAPGMTLKAAASFGGKEMGAAGAAVEGGQATLVLDLKEAHLWAVGDPNLYDLNLSVVRGDAVVDALDSYFGLRSVTIEGRAILINGKAVFQRTVLDQGFYPDGIWTAPTD
ncbi:MAG TPA: beta-galactosidase, partial [Candidatus Hydrogenedentes bacterium]|nr:beta-galactosidase [Candidatus Hydrogenedentota bacterium]